MLAALLANLGHGIDPGDKPRRRLVRMRDGSAYWDYGPESKQLPQIGIPTVIKSIRDHKQLVEALIAAEIIDTD